MNAEEKKKRSNEKRLQAVIQWKKSQRNQKTLLTAKTSDINVDLSVTDKGKGKLKLFDSDGEEDTFEDCFAVRPQFEGPRGQHLLEVSSQFPSRFKLDERFVNKEEPCELAEKNEEKVKNLKILESVLGYEVTEKYEEKSSAKKRKLMRFDPEDEDAVKYIKTSISDEKSKKKSSKKKVAGVNTKEEEIPISTERYIEVSSNLKDILISSSSKPFCLSQKFNENNKYDENNYGFDISVQHEKEINQEASSNNYFSAKTDALTNKSENLFSESKGMKRQSFFILEHDDRLKEGVSFFMRPKPLEEIREEWKKSRDEVLEIFRGKRKSSQRNYSKKIQIAQRKHFSKKSAN